MRILRGMGALLILVSLIVGVPMALVVLGGNPLPDGISGRTLGDVLLRPDDGTILIGLITIVGWLAWAALAVSIVAELIVAGSGHRVRVSLPGLAGPRRLVAALIITVAAMLAVPTVAAQAEPVARDPLPGDEPASVSRPKTAPASRAKAARAEADSAPTRRTQDGEAAAQSRTDVVRHTVKAGDELWSLAEKYYGHGREWRKIAAANPSVLTGGPDRLQPGWVLGIPEATNPPESNRQSVTVRTGETLSSIAETHLGDASQWPQIFRANRAVLSTPDAVDEGMSLIIPGAPLAPERSAETSGSEQQRDRSKDSRDTSGESSADKRSRPGRTGHGDSAAEDQRESASGEPGSGEPGSGEPGSGEPGSEDLGRDESGEERSSGESIEESAPGQAPTRDGPTRPQDLAPLQQDGESLAGMVGVGSLLAAALVGGLATRRRLQLLARPVGRRILQPSPAAQVVESELARRARPLSLRSLDLAVRAISAHCRATQAPLPTLQLARVGDDEIELIMAEQDLDAPVGFAVSGCRWLLGIEDARYLKSVPGLSEAARPYPALVSLGRDDAGSLALVDLENIGILHVQGADAEQASGVLRAMALELSCTPWAQELNLTLTGRNWSLPEALGTHQVKQTENVDEMLAGLAGRAAQQRDHLTDGQRVANYRTDPDLADAWAPEIVAIDGPITAAQLSALETIAMTEPRPPIAVVINTALGDRTEAEGQWRLELSTLDGVARGELLPHALELSPQIVDRTTDEHVVELLSTTGSEQTTAAPWWAPDPVGHADGNVTFIAQQENGWAREESAIVEEMNMIDPAESTLHPMLRLLGPVDLLGAGEEPPTRATRQCLEYCAWLLEHPGTTAQQMASALAVAEGTRRSNMSRLRRWLGTQPDGEAYLPDAYTGTIRLDSCVSSDWDRLKLLTMRGVNRVSIDSLTAALQLVRGAPLADAAPGQWHWAEELRTDMASVIRDVGVELTRRALDDHDLDLARWAASRSLVAAPADELLICARIRTEFEAGNRAAVERLALQLTAHARQIGVDLEEETITLLQRVLEGRPRARLA